MVGKPGNAPEETRGDQTMTRRVASLAAVLALTGCHTGPRLRIASPQFQRAPEITCIIFVQGDKISDDLAKAAISACKDAAEERKP